MDIQATLKKIDKKFEGRKFLRITLGICFLIIGVIGGFIPILQGWIFIFFGCYLLFGEKFVGKLKIIKNKFKRKKSGKK